MIHGPTADRAPAERKQSQKPLRYDKTGPERDIAAAAAMRFARIPLLGIIGRLPD